MLPKRIAIIGRRGIGKTEYAKRLVSKSFSDSKQESSEGVENFAFSLNTNYGLTDIELSVVPEGIVTPDCDATVVIVDSGAYEWSRAETVGPIVVVSEENLSWIDYNITEDVVEPIFFLLSCLKGDKIMGLEDGSKLLSERRQDLENLFDKVLLYIARGNYEMIPEREGVKMSSFYSERVSDFREKCMEYLASYLTTYKGMIEEWRDHPSENEEAYIDRRETIILPFYVMFPILTCIINSLGFLSTEMLNFA